MPHTPVPLFAASLPVPKPTLSYWQSDPDPVLENYQSPQFSDHAEVVIIGSGLSGAFIAHGLLSSESSPRPASVIMLEARTAGSGATGRNGGHIKPDCYRGFASYSVLHGEEVAKQQCHMEAANHQDTVSFIRDNGLAEEVDLVDYRSADVYLTESSWLSGLKTYEAFKAAGGHVSQIRILDKDQAEKELRVTACYGAITFPASSLWPYRLAMAMLHKNLAMGMALHTNTPVTAVTPIEGAASAAGDGDAASYRWRVETERGSIAARHVIHATNGYVSHLVPELEGRVIPFKGHVSALAPPLLYKDTPLSTSFAFISDSVYDYVIQRPHQDRLVIWGGGEAAHPHGQLGGWGDCDDSQDHEEIQHRIQATPAEVLQDWSTGNITNAVPFAWSGVMGLSKDMLPFVGELPSKPGQHVVAGFHGHGMARVFLTCRAFCQHFLGEHVDARVPAPYFDIENRIREPIDLELTANL